MKKSREMNDITAKAVNNSAQIGKIVREHRVKANLTQIELAELSGTGKTVIFDLEKGKPTVKLKTLLMVLKSLNISLFLDSPIMAALEKTK